MSEKLTLVNADGSLKEPQKTENLKKIDDKDFKKIQEIEIKLYQFNSQIGALEFAKLTVLNERLKLDENIRDNEKYLTHKYGLRSHEYIDRDGFIRSNNPPPTQEPQSKIVKP